MPPQSASPAQSRRAGLRDDELAHHFARRIVAGPAGDLDRLEPRQRLIPAGKSPDEGMLQGVLAV